MAESVNGGNSQEQPPKEMSMEVRLLLAFLLMGAVMFVWQLIYKPEPPPGTKKTAPTAESTGAKGVPSAPGATGSQPQPEPASAPAETAQTIVPASSPTSPATSQRPEPVFIVNTDLFRVTFSNQGATVRSWILKKYHGNDEKP